MLDDATIKTEQLYTKDKFSYLTFWVSYLTQCVYHRVCGTSLFYFNQPNFINFNDLLFLTFNDFFSQKLNRVNVLQHL